MATAILQRLQQILPRGCRHNAITRFGNYSLGYSVYIDLNGDNDFEDDGELVWSKTPLKTAPVLGSFTVQALQNRCYKNGVSMGYEFSLQVAEIKILAVRLKTILSILLQKELSSCPYIYSGTTSSSTVLNGLLQKMQLLLPSISFLLHAKWNCK
jgi:hypothetical protein